MIKKLLPLFLFLSQSLFACATCQLMIPTAEVTLGLNVKEKQLATSDVEWYFSDLYTQEITKQYDKNRNLILDKEELAVILKAKLDYLKPKNMLMAMKIGDSVDENEVTPSFKNFNLRVVNERLLFSYQFNAHITLKDQAVLSFKFEDDEAFFSFILHTVTIEGGDFHTSINNYLYTSAILFSTAPLQKQEVQASSQDQEIVEQEGLLNESIARIKTLFEEIKDDQKPYSYFLLLLFAFAYGLIHALGPGHGKTLVASYFLSNDKSYTKALLISLAIGVVHTFSAFLLTLVIYFVVESFLAQFMDNTITYTTKISALIIIAIAVYLLYKKIRAHRALARQKNFANFSTTPPHISSCGCASCKVENNSTDLALILSAGIIPCPGTVTLFIFALSLEMYTLGFFSAFVMSLGMSSIIFISAILSVTIRKKALKSNTKLQKILEYGSLFVILLLGLLLLF